MLSIRLGWVRNVTVANWLRRVDVFRYVLNLRDLRGGRIVAVGRGQRRLDLGDPGWQEQQAERVTELSAHHAV